MSSVGVIGVKSAMGERSSISCGGRCFPHFHRYGKHESLPTALTGEITEKTL